MISEHNKAETEEADVEYFCEKHGFTFHTGGRGKWGAFPYYSFECPNTESTNGFKMAYCPHSCALSIVSLRGKFEGRIEFVQQLLLLADAMGIDSASISNDVVAHENATFKQNRKAELTNRIAAKIQAQYGFLHEKCLHLAMQSKWWKTTNRLSQLSNRLFESYAAQVMEEIENGEVK